MFKCSMAQLKQFTEKCTPFDAQINPLRTMKGSLLSVWGLNVESGGLQVRFIDSLKRSTY